MAVHAEALAVFADRHGLPALTAADRAKLDGRRNSKILPVLLNRPMARDEWPAWRSTTTRSRPVMDAHLGRA